MIAVFGAGAIGCWVGGMLAAGGASVTLIGRARVLDELPPVDDARAREAPLHDRLLRVSELGGADRTVEVATATEPAAAADASLVLVAVKSPATAAAGATLAGVLRPGAVVVSLQNGIRNADVLRVALPDHTVLAAMVPFNVVRRGAGAYHRASSGTLVIEDAPAAAPMLDACRAAGLAITTHPDMRAVQWAKLVMNLNNAVNALSGLPLATELARRPFRRCLAAAQREALELLAHAGQPVARLTAIPPRWMPRLLELPDPIFRVLARRVIAIDPQARSSMWDDLEARRATEIDQLQGEVVALAERLGRAAPINAALVRLIREAEAGGARDLAGPALSAALGVPG